MAATAFHAAAQQRRCSHGQPRSDAGLGHPEAIPCSGSRRAKIPQSQVENHAPSRAATSSGGSTTCKKIRIIEGARFRTGDQPVAGIGACARGPFRPEFNLRGPSLAAFKSSLSGQSTAMGATAALSAGHQAEETIATGPREKSGPRQLIGAHVFPGFSFLSRS